MISSFVEIIGGQDGFPIRVESEIIANPTAVFAEFLNQVP
jgi:hypothetical protein